MRLNATQKRIRNTVIIVVIAAMILAIAIPVFVKAIQAYRVKNYRQYTEWELPFEIEMRATDHYLGHHQYNSMNYDVYYALNDISSNQMILVDRVENPIVLVKQHEEFLYYNAKIVNDPKDILKPQKAVLSLWDQTTYGAPSLTMTLTDSADLTTLTNSLFEAESMEKSNLNTLHNKVQLKVELDSVGDIWVRLELCTYQGEWYWKVNRSSESVYIIPLDSYMKDIIEHGFTMTKA